MAMTETAASAQGSSSHGEGEGSVAAAPMLSPPNKRSPTGMHVAVALDDASDDKPHVVSRLLQSRVGRDQQRYDGERRLLACIVVARGGPTPEQEEFLLISSSKHPAQWILPKGGWESDESVVECAQREAEEEAGVVGNVVGELGVLDFASQQSKPCRFHGFKLQATQVFHDWAENSRRRKWVCLDEAQTLLRHRPELQEMLMRAAGLGNGADAIGVVRQRMAAVDAGPDGPQRPGGGDVAADAHEQWRSGSAQR